MYAIMLNRRPSAVACLMCVAILIFLFPHGSALARDSVTQPNVPMIGDYAGELREKQPRKDGFTHVDTPRLVRRLQEMGVNTYFYLIWHSASDWDDLRLEFLPAAKEAGIDVWVYLVPPSEARERRSEPYGTDYVAWMRAVGHLSRSFSNLKGVVMDDFNHNLSVFTPDYLRRMRAAGHEANPHLRFYPQIYQPAIRKELLSRYRGLFDGIVMTYRDGIYRNTQRTQQLEHQVTQISRLLHREGLPFVLMVHASKLSATPANPSARYVNETLRAGLSRLTQGELQGLITYVLQKDWFPETRDRLAKVGHGYGCLFVPPGSHPPAGRSGELKQVVFPEGPPPYRLTFYHRVIAPARLPAGQYIQEILVNGNRVWSQDAAIASRKNWQQKKLDLTPWLKGKREAVLQLRLARKQTGSRSWLFAAFDHLEATGFKMENPEFETAIGWTAYADHPAIIGETLVYDPRRRMRVYLQTMTLFRAYRWQEEIASALPEEFQKQREDFRNHLLQGRPTQALSSLDSLLKPFRQSSLESQHRLLQEGEMLKRLLSIAQ